MTIDELIDALEKAEGPSRELNFWVWWWGKANRGPSTEPDSDYVASNLKHNDAPLYTYSLDAALTLVPEGWIWSVSSSGCVWVMPSDDVEGQIVVSGIADPIIALCIAALKARRNA